MNGTVETYEMNHLDQLEAEAIYIFREVMAQARKPVMLYSVGKDSSVLVHLARKAFALQNPLSLNAHRYRL